jgi:hypothetical protein
MTPMTPTSCSSPLVTISCLFSSQMSLLSNSSHSSSPKPGHQQDTQHPSGQDGGDAPRPSNGGHTTHTQGTTETHMPPPTPLSEPVISLPPVAQDTLAPHLDTPAPSGMTTQPLFATWTTCRLLQGPACTTLLPHLAGSHTQLSLQSTTGLFVAVMSLICTSLAVCYWAGENTGWWRMRFSHSLPGSGRVRSGDSRDLEGWCGSRTFAGTGGCRSPPCPASSAMWCL